MQRFVSLGMLALLVGGGWSTLRGLSPESVQQAVRSVGAVVGPALTQAPLPTQPAQYGPAYGVAPAPSAPGFAPAPSLSAPPSIRVATFNIQTFGEKKASKPYVMKAIAQVVRSFDVVAIQEIRTKDDYFVQKFLRDYVNTPGAGPVYDARVSRRLGRTQSTEQYAFVFNTSTVEVHPTFCAVVPDPEDRLHREPYAALFQTRVVNPYKPFTFTLVNVHTDPDEVAAELDALYHVYRQVQRTPVGGAVEDDVILLGDFNTNVPAASRYTPGAPQRPIAPSDLGLLANVAGIAPLVRREATNTRGTRLYDNLLIPSLTTVEYLDHGVVDLRTALGFELKLEEALEISDHLPVWGQFSAIEGDAYRSALR